MVRIQIVTKKGKFDDVLRKIRKRHDLTINSANYILNEIYLTPKVDNIQFPKNIDLKDALQRMRGVEHVAVIDPYLNNKNTELTDAFATNNCKFILDIDSTLTRSGSRAIHHTIRPILQNMVDRGIWIYVATGRSLSDLTNLIQQYGQLIQPYSIAENGGLILGFPPRGYLELGSKDEPRKVLKYLQSHYRIKEDMKQGERITEVIFLQSDVSEDQFDEAIKATKAKVALHKSQNSYHVSAKNVNKGSSILELADRMNWGNIYKIAVGDSQLDVPMFNVCDYSFAPKNCDKYARKACSQVVDGSYEKCLAKIWDLILKTEQIR